jgi:hypothetical protein
VNLVSNATSVNSAPDRRWLILGVLLVSGGVFCLVYGFSNAATHTWDTPSTYGFLAVGAALLIAFALWQGRAAHPLLPPRVVVGVLFRRGPLVQKGTGSSPNGAAATAHAEARPRSSSV